MTSQSDRAGGNGHGRGLVDVVAVSEGCVLFTANPQQPPPEGEIPLALSEVLRKWMLGNPVRVRETLPLTRGGHTTALCILFDRAGP
jgi:hypothetical protein